jgi:hypothetical protein
MPPTPRTTTQQKQPQSHTIRYLYGFSIMTARKAHPKAAAQKMGLHRDSNAGPPAFVEVLVGPKAGIIYTLLV